MRNSIPKYVAHEAMHYWEDQMLLVIAQMRWFINSTSYPYRMTMKQAVKHANKAKSSTRFGVKKPWNKKKRKEVIHMKGKSKPMTKKSGKGGKTGC